MRRRNTSGWILSGMLPWRGQRRGLGGRVYCSAARPPGYWIVLLTTLDSELAVPLLVKSETAKYQVPAVRPCSV
jgi:hypothetical protein